MFSGLEDAFFALADMAACGDHCGLVFGFGAGKQDEHFGVFGDKRLDENAGRRLLCLDLLPVGENRAVVADHSDAEPKTGRDLGGRVAQKSPMQQSQYLAAGRMIERIR